MDRLGNAHVFVSKFRVIVDQTVLAGEDQALSSLIFRVFDHVIHERRRDSLAAVVRDHIQSENRLVCAVRPVAGGIFVHLVINRFGICGAAIDEAYDLSVRFRNKKALRKCRDAGLK